MWVDVATVVAVLGVFRQGIGASPIMDELPGKRWHDGTSVEQTFGIVKGIQALPAGRPSKYRALVFR